MSDGFRDWKNGTYSSVARPDEVMKRFGLCGEEAAGDAVQQLDQVATRNTLPMLPSGHVRTDAIMAKVLGLDQATRQMRLRAAVARAYASAWDYTSAYVKRQEDAKAAEVAAARVRGALSATVEAMDMSVVASFDGLYRSSSPGVWSDLRAAANLLNTSAMSLDASSTAVAAAHNEAHRPDRFLYLRLAEIYIGLFGVSAPLHQSGSRTKDNGPDELFASFLTSALVAVDWPTPHSSRDAALRGLNIKVLGGLPYVRRRLDQLQQRVAAGDEVLKYEDLVSLGWLMDMDPSGSLLTLADM